MPDRWVSFDCYGTLVDWRTGMTDALRSVVGDEAPALLEAYHRHEHVVETEGFRRYRDVLREALLRAARDVALDLSDADVLSRTLPDWPVFADVHDGLAALRARGFRLAILSNVDRDLIAGTLPRLGEPIDVVVTAEDVRSYKPAPVHFERFQELTGATPATWVHAACSEFHDIGTARALGVPCVRVLRPREDPASRATAVIDGLAELPEVAASAL